MPYEKRVCVLKQIKKGFSADGGTLSGAVYAERMGEELTVTPRIPGIAPIREGRYALALCIEGEIRILALEGGQPVRAGKSPSVKKGFSALLVLLRGEAEPIAYGSCGTAPSDYAPLLAAIRENGTKKREREEPARPFREKPVYDDDAIAGSNYYQQPPHDDDGLRTACVGSETAQADGSDPLEDADGESADPHLPEGALAYYDTVKERLREAFGTFPRDTRLNAVFPCSEWVRAEGALLGIIYREGRPHLLCVAVEAKGEAPAGMQHACFVPATPFSDEEGFWVVFQSADSGAYVTVKES